MSDYMRALRAKVGSQLVQIPSVTILTFDDADRVLLVKHGDVRLWTTPGGAIDPLETPRTPPSARCGRTGLHVELVRVLGVYGGPEFQTTYSNGEWCRSRWRSSSRGRSPARCAPTATRHSTCAISCGGGSRLDVQPWVRPVWRTSSGTGRGLTSRRRGWRPPR